MKFDACKALIGFFFSDFCIFLMKTWKFEYNQILWNFLVIIQIFINILKLPYIKSYLILIEMSQKLKPKVFKSVLTFLQETAITCERNRGHVA